MGDAENANMSGEGQGEGGSSVESPEVTYTVQPGDTLSKIAKEYYGDSGQYRAIYEANRDKLDDPDEIRVGQELRIPPATS